MSQGEVESGRARAVRSRVVDALRAARGDVALTTRVLLRKGQLRRLLLAEGQSALGDALAYIALLLIAYQRLHSPWALSAVLLAARVPLAAFSPIAGVLADSVSRRLCLITADAMRLLGLIGIVLTSSFVVTVVLAAVLGFGTTLYRPAAEASLQVVAGEGEAAARTVTSRWTINFAGTLLGSSLAGTVLLLSSAKTVLLLDAATFAISIAVLSTLHLDSARSTVEETRSRRADTAMLLAEGVRALRRLPGLVVLVLTTMGAIVAGSMINVGEPLLAKNVLHAGDAGFAALVVCCGVGLVIGTGLSGPRGRSIGTLRLTYCRALALEACGVGLLAIAPALPIAMLGSLVQGAGNGLAVARLFQLFQLTVPKDLVGRVTGINYATEAIAYITAFLLAGAAVTLLGVRALFALGCAGGLTTAFIGYALMRGLPDRRAQADAPPLAIVAD